MPMTGAELAQLRANARQLFVDLSDEVRGLPVAPGLQISVTRRRVQDVVDEFEQVLREHNPSPDEPVVIFGDKEEAWKVKLESVAVRGNIGTRIIVETSYTEQLKNGQGEQGEEDEEEERVTRNTMYKESYLRQDAPSTSPTRRLGVLELDLYRQPSNIIELKGKVVVVIFDLNYGAGTGYKLTVINENRVEEIYEVNRNGVVGELLRRRILPESE